MADTGAGKWMTAREAYQPPVALQTDQPHAARMYDYLLGGKDNFAADREATEKAVAAFPALRTAARENRRFLGRAVRHLVEEVGIRQFLDIGSGLPTAENVHQVAQRHDPEARVVYVDNDPLVLVHGRALLMENDHTVVIQADARDPKAILDHPSTRDLIDFEKPVAVLMVAILHFIRDEQRPLEILRVLREAMPPGSHFVLSHGATDISPAAALGVQSAYQARGVPLVLRSRPAFEAFFDGLELVEPGIQVVSDWRPEVPVEQRPSHAEVCWYGGIGRISG